MVLSPKMMITSCVIIFSLTSIPVLCVSENVVGVLSSMGGYEQIITSSTLRWIAHKNGKVPENAVQGATIRANAENDEVEKPVWVCRALANGMWVPGKLATDDDSNSGKCVVSIHGSMSAHQNYEVLQNAEDRGKLTWVEKDKYSMPPGGSVSAGSDTAIYIARIKAKPNSPVSHLLGRLDKSMGLTGKILVAEDGVERDYEKGEVLVETEPIRYEMTNVKFNYWRARYQRESIALDFTILRNDDVPVDDAFEGDVSRVDTVMAYRHNHTLSWGHGHAILTGLPVKVRLHNGTELNEIKWAIDTFTTADSTYQVETFLQPGRGVNVTLKGNWTESNIPYVANVTAIYPDDSKKSREINGIKRELGIRDVHPEFGPVYYLHNNSHVPTTTTTTTTTTSTTSTTSATTSKTTSTTTTEEAKPIPASPMEELNSTTKKGDPADPGRKKENQSMLSDGPKSETSTSGGKSGGWNLQGNTVICLVLTGVHSLLIRT